MPSDEEDRADENDPKSLKDRRRSIGVASPPKLTIHTSSTGSSTAFDPLRTGGGKMTPRSGKMTPRSGKFTVPKESDALSFKTCTKFIKLKGVPKPVPSEDPNSEPFPNETPLAVGTDGQPVKPTPAQAQAELAEDPSQKIVDVLAAQNEDPFTLEPLESLMQLHAEKGKDFILARVATVDPLDENRFYYSYYAAHHINKVLFRTQPEANLLHRMKAKNPLNNMTIIGDVHYYVFTAAQGREMDMTDTTSPRRQSSESARSAAGRPSRDLGFVRRHQYMVPSVTSPSTIVENLRQLLMGNHPVGKKRLHLFMSPEAVYVTDPSGKTPGDTLTDENGEFKNTARRLSADDIYVTALPPRNVRNGGNGGGNNGGVGVGGNLTTTTGTTRSVRDSVDSSATVPRPKSAQLYEAAPWSAGPVGSFPGPRQFRHHTVRSMSYMNDHVGATSPYDWVQLHVTAPEDDETTKGEKEKEEKARSEEKGGRSSFKKNHHRRTKSGTSRSIEDPATPSPRPKTLSPKTPSPIFYEFHYYATDDDFLMKSSVRQYFKQNALEPADSVLFTISSGTTTTLPTGDVEAHPALLGFHYSIEDTDDSNRRDRFCTCKYLKYLLLVYVALGFVLVKYVVAESYAYLAIFLLVFVLCFAMIFCVEIRDIQARNQVTYRTTE